VAYDIYRYVIAGQLDPLGKLVSKDLINHNPNKPGEEYTTTWFDMFRIVDGLMVEHWDGAKLKTN
jgi:predicted SnoaL-like aldol condensation-catalyzing enzyme